MGFLLVPKSMTLNDLERHYGLAPYDRSSAFLPKALSFGAAYHVKLAEARPTLSATKM